MSKGSSKRKAKQKKRRQEKRAVRKGGTVSSVSNTKCTITESND